MGKLMRETTTTTVSTKVYDSDEGEAELEALAEVAGPVQATGARPRFRREH